jgi:mono/diheme cytochrome c family protein
MRAIMAIPHLHRLIRVFIPVLGWAVAATWVGAGCTSYPSAPSDPAFDTEVLPVFQAHCTRCHGDGPDGGGLNAVAGSSKTGATAMSCLTQFSGSDAGACSMAADTDVGNHKLDAYVHGRTAGEQMPPPPAAPLNSYELGVIDAWVAENPLKCSDSPNPDPALHCVAGSYP